jgi:uncharacterized DUF497 family protein
MPMRLTWDQEKRRSNLAKHGLDFADAEAVFRGAVFIFEDKRRSYGEQRFVALGMLKEIVVAVAFSEPEEDSLRIISMRKAIRNEQQIYFEQLAH